MRTASHRTAWDSLRQRGAIRCLAALAGLTVFCRTVVAASPAVSLLGTSAGLGLSAAGDFPGEVPAGLAALLGGGSAENPAPETVSRPWLGALSARGLVGHRLDRYLKIPGVLDSLTVPEAFSVVMWVRIAPDQRSTILLGFGEPGGDYLVLATDSSGAPSLAFLNPTRVSQVNRAGASPAHLADARLHALVAVVNLGSGLVRLYVDGHAEAATTISFWRPRCIGPAFASYLLLGRTSLPGAASEGLLMPRIVARELTEDEIAVIKPDKEGEEAALDEALGARLAKDTLVEFWPSQYAYLLRQRPLGNSPADN